MPSTKHHDEWEREYWATQPEPKPGTREHLDKYGGFGPHHVIGCAIVAIVAVGLLLWVLYYSLTLPIVYESYTTGECVRVVDVRGVYSCENLPRKYHHAWVE